MGERDRPDQQRAKPGLMAECNGASGGTNMGTGTGEGEGAGAGAGRVPIERGGPIGVVKARRPDRGVVDVGPASRIR